MGRCKQLSEREKGKISAYKALNLSKRDIARRIRRSVHCISTFLENGEEYGKNFYGRPRVLTSRDCRRLRNAASNSKKSITGLRNELSFTASIATISRRLKEMGVVSKRLVRKPPLTAAHKAARMEFCRVYLKQDWSSVWFTDEKRWCLDGPDRYSKYWHDLRKEELLGSRRQGGGGSIMVWGGICGGRTTSLCFVNGSLNSLKYQDVLAMHLLPFLTPNDLFMQDNASIHASHSTRDWIGLHGIPLVDWPSRSPDLNPIENVWGIMARRVYMNGKQYASVHELKVAIERCWNSLTAQELSRLTGSMSDRIFHCISCQGKHVNY
jgi:transposase